ncbi:MAG: ABC transporter ATP-binding protein [Promethearchaeota archaeon]
MIDIKKLTFTYNQSDKPAIEDINLKIQDGEFVLITGPSGSGKSTLVRTFNGLIPHFYGGRISGVIYVQETDVFKTSTRKLAEKVGFVFQNPDNQLFMNNVEDELAFGLENLNAPINLIKKRIEETLDAIGIAHLRKRPISELSGGEKQKVAIAAVLTTQPEILILDEPTAELDPKSAEEVLALIQKLNDELGITIILIEHRLDRVIQFVDRIIIIEQGKIIHDGAPKKIFQKDLSHIGITIPPIVRLSNQLEIPYIPLTVKESRKNLKNTLNKVKVPKIVQNCFIEAFKDYSQLFDKKDLMVEFKNISFSYDKNQKILENINLQFHKGEFIAIMGRNGSGKTTLLKHINGLLRPNKGKVFVENRNIEKYSVAQLAQTVGFIFQNPAMQFFQDTVEEEVAFVLDRLKYEYDDIAILVENMLKKFDLEKYRKTYPRYLSVGEQQKVALASVLISNPKIIVLDEPTHGMDYNQKSLFFSYLNEYRDKGNLVILVTHDVESIAEYSDRVVLISEGHVVVDDLKRNVLSNALLFSPQINRLVQGFKNLPQKILNYYELIKVINHEKK